MRLAGPLARAAGIDLVVGDFYSPVPRARALPEHVWSRPHELHGLRLDTSAQIGFLGDELAGFVREFDPPREAPPGGGFHLDNGTYGSVDAEVLYAMIRRHRPRRVVELGSGSSSLVVAEALARNSQDGHPCSYVTFDPFPRPDLVAALDRATDLRRISATDVPLDQFRTLAAGDVLFVDTTHTVKAGSDVNRIVLDVLPVLAPGVVVHFHDIFLPWEYPREWLIDEGYYWAEQYLLQAFLAYNREFEVLVASHALARSHRGELARIVPSLGPSNRPSSFWIRRVAGPANS